MQYTIKQLEASGRAGDAMRQEYSNALQALYADTSVQTIKSSHTTHTFKLAYDITSDLDKLTNDGNVTANIVADINNTISTQGYPEGLKLLGKYLVKFGGPEVNDEQAIRLAYQISKPVYIALPQKEAEKLSDNPDLYEVVEFIQDRHRFYVEAFSNYCNDLSEALIVHGDVVISALTNNNKATLVNDDNEIDMSFTRALFEVVSRVNSIALPAPTAISALPMRMRMDNITRPANDFSAAIADLDEKRGTMIKDHVHKLHLRRLTLDQSLKPKQIKELTTTGPVKEMEMTLKKDTYNADVANHAVGIINTLVEKLEALDLTPTNHSSEFLSSIQGVALENLRQQAVYINYCSSAIMNEMCKDSIASIGKYLVTVSESFEKVAKSVDEK